MDSKILRFKEAGPPKWWGKRLVLVEGRALPLPAELAVLRSECQKGEVGVWLNSRGKRTGVVDFIRREDGKYRTQREALPAFVSGCLTLLYKETGLTRGCPDLLIWNSDQQNIRMVEVKCPRWDKLTNDQLAFLQAAEKMGIQTKTIEWVPADE
jgi:hypothetical protein